MAKCAIHKRSWSLVGTSCTMAEGVGEVLQQDKHSQGPRSLGRCCEGRERPPWKRCLHCSRSIRCLQCSNGRLASNGRSHGCPPVIVAGGCAGREWARIHAAWGARRVEGRKTNVWVFEAARQRKRIAREHSTATFEKPTSNRLVLRYEASYLGFLPGQVADAKTQP